MINVLRLTSISVFAYFIIKGWGGNPIHQDSSFFFLKRMFLKELRAMGEMNLV